MLFWRAHICCCYVTFIHTFIFLLPQIAQRVQVAIMQETKPPLRGWGCISQGSQPGTLFYLLKYKRKWFALGKKNIGKCETYCDVTVSENSRRFPLVCISYRSIWHTLAYYNETHPRKGQQNIPQLSYQNVIILLEVTLIVL